MVSNNYRVHSSWDVWYLTTIECIVLLLSTQPLRSKTFLPPLPLLETFARKNEERPCWSSARQFGARLTKTLVKPEPLLAAALRKGTFAVKFDFKQHTEMPTPLRFTVDPHTKSSRPDVPCMTDRGVRGALAWNTRQTTTYWTRAFFFSFWGTRVWHASPAPPSKHAPACAQLLSYMSKPHELARVYSIHTSVQPNGQTQAETSWHSNI